MGFSDVHLQASANRVRLQRRVRRTQRGERLIVVIATVFGALYAIGSSLGHWKRHRNHGSQGGRAG